MTPIDKKYLQEWLTSELKMQEINLAESSKESANESDHAGLNQFMRSVKNAKRADVLKHIIDNNVPVYESNVQGCVEVLLKRPDKPEEYAIVALKGKVQFNGRGKWYPYSFEKLIELLKYAV